MYGPNSVEVEDTYLRLDKDLADFFTYLDKKIGRGNYSLFLTADHGGAHNISFLQSHHLAGDFLKTKNILTNLNAHLERSFKLHTMVTGSSSTFLSFNVAAIKKAGLNYNEVKEEAMDFLRKQPGIQFTADMQNLHKTSIPKDIMEKLVNAYNSKRCGDVAIVPEPGWFNGREKGTGHSLWNPFDTHIPMVFMGWGIKKGHSEKAHSMNDLAPTLAALLKIQVPNGSVGRVMEEVLVH